MKFLALLFTTAIIGVMANPVSDTTTTGVKLVAFTSGSRTAIGESMVGVQAKAAMCNGNEFAYGSRCTPGNCDCAGDNGCWCYDDQPYCMCQCNPCFNENEDCTGFREGSTCNSDNWP